MPHTAFTKQRPSGLVPRRCKSALSLSLCLQGSSSSPQQSSINASVLHTDSYGDLTTMDSSTSVGSEGSTASQATQQGVEVDPKAEAIKAVDIPYTR